MSDILDTVIGDSADSATDLFGGLTDDSSAIGPSAASLGADTGFNYGDSALGGVEAGSGSGSDFFGGILSPNNLVGALGSALSGFGGTGGGTNGVNLNGIRFNPDTNAATAPRAGSGQAAPPIKSLDQYQVYREWYRRAQEWGTPVGVDRQSTPKAQVA